MSLFFKKSGRNIKHAWYKDFYTFLENTQTNLLMISTEAVFEPAPFEQLAAAAAFCIYVSLEYTRLLIDPHYTTGVKTRAK